MAITPISQYRGQDNSLVQILQGGNNAITSILNQAIQLGRDRVNNQMRQEDQMFQQRQSETALSQRRGENLTSLIQDSQRMAQTQREADRRYDLLARQDARSAEQNLFNQGLALSGENRKNQELGLRERQLNLQEERLDAGIERQATLDALNTRQVEQNMSIAEAEERRRQALFDNPQSDVGMTPAQKLAREKFELSQKTNSQKQNEERLRSMVLGDQAAFNPQWSFLNDNSTEKQRAEAATYDKNAFESEVQSARNMSKKEYASKIRNPTPALIKKREELWEFANGGQTPAPVVPSGGGVPSPLDWLKKPLGE